MTLDQLKTALQARGYASDTGTAQTELINQVYREVVSLRQWSWLEEEDEQALTAGTVEYTPTAAEIARVLSVRLEPPTAETSDRTSIPLRFVEQQEFRNLYGTWEGESVPVGDRGEPIWHTFFDGKVHVWPAPDKAYLLKVDYTPVITALAGGSDVALIPLDFHDILVAGAAALIALRERDFASADRFQNEYISRRSALFREESIRQRGTSVRVNQSGVYDHMALGRIGY